MTKLITGADCGPEFLAALKRLGFPDRLISLTLEIPEDKPIVASCTFYPTADDGDLQIVAGAFVRESKRFALVALDDEPPEQG